jgi:hypothetical protein
MLLLAATCCTPGALQVKQLLADARDPDALLTALPSLMDPRTLISVLVTVKKWCAQQICSFNLVQSCCD